MKKLINLPDSFENYGEAERHLEKCVELLVSQKLHVPLGLKPKDRIILLCEALNTNPQDIFDRVRR